MKIDWRTKPHERVMRAFKLARDIDRLIPLSTSPTRLEIEERMEIALTRELLDAVQELEK